VIYSKKSLSDGLDAWDSKHIDALNNKSRCPSVSTVLRWVTSVSIIPDNALVSTLEKVPQIISKFCEVEKTAPLLAIKNIDEKTNSRNIDAIANSKPISYDSKPACKAAPAGIFQKSNNKIHKNVSSNEIVFIEQSKDSSSFNVEPESEQPILPFKTKSPKNKSIIFSNFKHIFKFIFNFQEKCKKPSISTFLGLTFWYIEGILGIPCLLQKKNLVSPSSKCSGKTSLVKSCFNSKELKLPP